MISSIANILTEFGANTVEEIRANLDSKRLTNTGNTKRQTNFSVEASENRVTLIVFAPSHLVALEEGAAPISRRTTGGFLNAIKEWAESKLGKTEKEALGLAFGYLKNRTGQGSGGLTTDSAGNYLVPNRFNPGGVISDAISDDRIRLLQVELLKSIGREFINVTGRTLRDGTNR